MTMQMYLVLPKQAEDDHDRELIAEFIASRGGFMLMTTSRGSMIVAFDDRYLEAVQRHFLVKFAGGINLDPNAPGAEKLQLLFARNVALQLAGRGAPPPRSPAHSAELPPSPTTMPPGYRPIHWPKPNPEEDGTA